MTRPFTGRHMAVSIVAFFSVVIAVNLVMATFAARTFSGTVVDNSYVASQHFNRWLREASDQARTGWTMRIARDGGGILLVLRDAGAPAEAAQVDALATHPLGLLPDATLVFRPLGGGRYEADRPLAAGRWRLHVRVRQSGQDVRFVEDLGA